MRSDHSISARHRAFLDAFHDPRTDKQKLVNLAFNILSMALEEHPFVVATCSNAASQILRNSVKAKIIANGEAYASKELETLLCVTSNIKFCQLAVLIGDSKQRPTVFSSSMKKGEGLWQGVRVAQFLSQMKRSLISRLAHTNYPLFRLDCRFTQVKNRWVAAPISCSQGQEAPENEGNEGLVKCDSCEGLGHRHTECLQRTCKICSEKGHTVGEHGRL